MSEVKVDTISERTAAGGVTIDGVLVKDGVATFQTAAGSPLVFEGATADAFETTFAITDPTADRTITFPDSSFTVPTSGFTDIQKIQEVVASGDTNINFDNTKFVNNKIGSLKVNNSNLFLENNDLILSTNILVDIKNLDSLKCSRGLCRGDVISKSLDSLYRKRLYLQSMDYCKFHVSDSRMIVHSPTLASVPHIRN
jgi:hypothetical protein